MHGEFDFSLKNILNKTILFNTSKIDQNVIMDKIIESINESLKGNF